MDPLSPTSFDELKRRHEAALRTSALAVQRHPDVYRQLRRHAALVVYGSLDIGAYYDTAQQMVRYLEALCQVGAGTVFVFYRRALDPRSEGHVRTFRPLCSDLLATLAELDRWRSKERRLRCVK